MARTPDTGERRDLRLPDIRVSPTEASELERIQCALGARYTSDTVRALPRLYDERETLLRDALAPLRGKLTRGEVSAIVDVQNGCHLLGELLGQHVVANICDSPEMDEKWDVDRQSLATRLDLDATKATLVALELWAADLWRRSEDDELWEREIAWLAGE